MTYFWTFAFNRRVKLDTLMFTTLPSIIRIPAVYSIQIGFNIINNNSIMKTQFKSCHCLSSIIPSSVKMNISITELKLDLFSFVMICTVFRTELVILNNTSTLDFKPMKLNWT